MRKYQPHTPEEMFAHVKACIRHKQPKKEYCKQHGIAHSTFQYWAKKYREQLKAEVAKDNPGFIPIKVQPEPETGQIHIGQLHFHYPNGIRVTCPDSVHPEVLKMLLNP
jgi:transposase-like protein